MPIESNSSKDDFEMKDFGSKSGGYIDVQEGTTDIPPSYETVDDGFDRVKQAETAKDLITQVIHVEDDPTQNPYTFRLFFLGTGLSIFGAVLQEIFYFKPQTIYVSVVFLTVIAYVLGEFMAFAIPRKGFFRYLNPGPFNQKEHAAITIMASAAAQAAASTEVLAAQQLFYGGYPSRAAGIFVTMSSQLLGFGIAGLLRDVLVYPTKMLWPINLPVATLLETLHRDKVVTKKRLKVFYWVFLAFFIWEFFPEYIFVVLTGVSVFCLADQNNLTFTYLFGGASGNEGLGFLNICLDWNYIASFQSPLWYPLQTTFNMMLGIIGCYILFMGAYYGNLYDSQNFPFMSQLLYNGTVSNITNYVEYNQSLVLNDMFEIDEAALAGESLPYLTGTYLMYLITSNAGLTAALVHMFLWNYDDVKSGWSFASPSNLRKIFQKETWMFWKPRDEEAFMRRKMEDPDIDPHYKLMLKNKYNECPQWWWASVLVVAFAVGLGCLYALNSTLPWWGFILATIITTVFTLFLGAQMGLTGFQFNTQPICQMLAGFIFPGRPLANFYFTCYTYNTLQQAQLLGKDMKLAQYAHLPPRCTFLVQVCGCLIGAIFNWFMMVQIVANQAPLLTSIQGSNIWSGQNIQQFNSLAISFSMANELYAVGKRYQWVTLSFLLGFLCPLPFYLGHRLTGWRGFSYLNTSIILWYMGNLFVGINSSLTSFFILAYISQFYIRRNHPQFFVKWNYLISAAMDGGTQVLVFVLTFAVFGGSGKAVPFPTWAGTPDSTLHNNDYCMINPANAG